MVFEITDDCTVCDVGRPEYPEEAFTEGDPKYIIESELCTDCASCAEVYPVK